MDFVSLSFRFVETHTVPRKPFGPIHNRGATPPPPPFPSLSPPDPFSCSPSLFPLPPSSQTLRLAKCLPCGHKLGLMTVVVAIFPLTVRKFPRSKNKKASAPPDPPWLQQGRALWHQLLWPGKYLPCDHTVRVILAPLRDLVKAAVEDISHRGAGPLEGEMGGEGRSEGRGGRSRRS